jgi:hypothetical protein
MRILTVAMEADPVRDIVYIALKISPWRRVFMAVSAILGLVDMRGPVDELSLVVAPPA